MPSHPKVLQKAVQALGSLLLNIGYEPYGRDKVVGLAMAGIPLASGLSVQFGFPMLYTRKLPEDVKTPDDIERYIRSHGQHALVEGDFRSGDRLIIVDDLVTKFDSKLLAVGQISREMKRRNIDNIELNDVVVLVDREQGAAKRAESMDYKLYSLIRFGTEGMDLLKGSFSEIEHSVISDYLLNYGKYQDLPLQKELEETAMKREK